MCYLAESGKDLRGLALAPSRRAPRGDGDRKHLSGADFILECSPALKKTNCPPPSKVVRFNRVLLLIQLFSNYGNNSFSLQPGLLRRVSFLGFVHPQFIRS